MSGNPPAYYQPYMSDDEGAESDESDSSMSTTDSIARGLDDPRYAIGRAVGADFKTLNDQLLFQRGNAGSAYTEQPKDTLNNSPLYKDPKKRIQTTLFSLKSSNRDTRVYPTTSDFSLKLPRIYKNVTQIQLVQISYEYFLNTIPDVSGLYSTIVNTLSTFGIDISECLECFQNSSAQQGIGVSELGRTHPILGNNVPLKHIVGVRPGRYDTNLLAQELDYQMNKTPPFNIISYTSHRNQFHSSRNLYHLFNEGGRYFHNKLTNEFKSSYTRKNIHDHYFPQMNYHSSALPPTEKETLVSYYYPVLREVFTSQYDHLYLDLFGNTFESARQRVLNHFEGLDSDFYYGLCTSNLPYLTKIRDQHTFRYNLINQYDWAYDPGMKRFVVKHTTLHPSIHADIKNRHNFHFQTLLHSAGLTSSQYSTLVATHERTKAVLTDLQRALHSSLVAVGIPFSIYPPSFLYNNTNIISTQNAGLLLGSQLTENDSHLYDIASGSLTYSTFGGVYTRAPIYNFNWTRLSDLYNESTDVIANPGNYDGTYASHLSTLVGRSVFSSTLGGGYLPGYSGIAFNFTGNTAYQDLYSTFQGYYSTSIGQASTLTNILSSQTNLTSNYVSEKYGNVLPSHIISNNVYLNGNGTGGVSFNAQDILLKPSTPFDTLSSGPSPTNKCCQLINSYLTNWYGCVPANYVVNTLPWKLGFSPTISNVFNFFSTIGSTQTTTPYNIYLQLNVEKSMNNMDVATKEDVSVTNLPTGENKVVLGKLLTEGSGLSDITQTIIQMPAQFQTPIGKLDHLHFTMLLDDLVPISKLFPFSFGFTEWDAVIQIDEEIGVLDRETDLSTVPRIEWSPDKRPF
jgi:hypothetical protein